MDAKMFFTSRVLLAFTFALFLSPLLSAFPENVVMHSLAASLDHDFEDFYTINKKTNMYEVLKNLINEFYESSVTHLDSQEKYKQIADFLKNHSSPKTNDNFDYEQREYDHIIQGCLMGGLAGFIAGAYASQEADKQYDGEHEDISEKKSVRLIRNFKVYKAHAQSASQAGYEKKYLHLLRKISRLRIK